MGGCAHNKTTSFPDSGDSDPPSAVQFKDGRYALRKAHIYSILSLRSFPLKQFQCSSNNNNNSHPFQQDRRALHLFVPPSSRRSMVGCSLVWCSSEGSVSSSSTPHIFRDASHLRGSRALSCLFICLVTASLSACSLPLYLLAHCLFICLVTASLSACSLPFSLLAHCLFICLLTATLSACSLPLYLLGRCLFICLVTASLSAWSFPLSPACPGQCIHTPQAFSKVDVEHWTHASLYASYSTLSFFLLCLFVCLFIFAAGSMDP